MSIAPITSSYKCPSSTIRSVFPPRNHVSRDCHVTNTNFLRVLQQQHQQRQMNNKHKTIAITAPPLAPAII